MTIQEGTFVVRDPETDNPDHLEYMRGYKVGIMVGMSYSRPGQPSLMANEFAHKYLKITAQEYIKKLEEFGGVNEVVAKFTHVLPNEPPPGLLRPRVVYEARNIFFKDKESAQACADWLNSRLAELKLLGQEYCSYQEEDFLKPRLQKLKGSKPFLSNLPTNPKLPKP